MRTTRAGRIVEPRPFLFLLPFTNVGEVDFDEVRPTSAPGRLSFLNSDWRRLITFRRNSKKDAPRRKFIGNSSACAFLTGRRCICALREGKPAEQWGPQSPKGLLGIGGSWAAKQSGGATKSSAQQRQREKGGGGCAPVVSISSTALSRGTKPAFFFRTLRLFFGRSVRQMS